MAQTYDERKAREGQRINAQSAAGRDIGDIPKCKNTRRRNSCRDDLERFCLTYHRPAFYLPFSADHRRAIAKIEAAVMEGGLFAWAMPRGSGKSRLCQVACEFALLYGWRSFVLLAAAEDGLADQSLDAIKVALETNDLLLADFPEVCYPVRRLGRISHRCKGQTYAGGTPTYIGWGEGDVVLPTIQGSKASGSVIRAKGLSASIRGITHTRPDGTTVRPDLAIVDDPQTDVSARSASQCNLRETLVTRAVLELAGPDVSMAGVCPCTVIQTGDVADRLLDRTLFPEWQGERMKLVYRMPDRLDLWEGPYADLLRKGFEEGGDRGEAAAAFYRTRREEMDAGCVLGWPERKKKGQLSGVQFAMDLKILKPAAFAAEYQNEPLKPAHEQGAARIDPRAASLRLNGVPRGVVPERAGTLTAFIDVQLDLLYYAVCGWEEGFTGHLIECGTYPRQDRPYYRKADARPTLAQATGVSSPEGSIWRGLEVLAEAILTQEWKTGAGAAVPVSRLLVDSGWQTDLVYRFCLQGLGRRYAAVLSPSKGIFISGRKTPMAEWQPRKPEKRGPGWVHRGALPGRPELFLIDANRWKSFVASRLAQAPGEPGAFFLYGDDPREHRLFCDHLAAEYRELRDGVEEWFCLPAKPDNEYLDALAGCAAAASREGVTLTAAGERPAERPAKGRTWRQQYDDARAKTGGRR